MHGQQNVKHVLFVVEVKLVAIIYNKYVCKARNVYEIWMKTNAKTVSPHMISEEMFFTLCCFITFLHALHNGNYSHFSTLQKRGYK
jgi:hypothetical protein